MKLRTKNVLIFLVATLLLVGIVHTISDTFLSNSYRELEQKEVSQTVEQIHGAVLNRYSALNSKLTDWASWDDTYKFVQDNNSGYITSNLNPASLRTFGANFLLFYNSTGNLVYGIGINLLNATKMPVPQSVLNLISTNTQIWNFRDIRSNFTGLVLIPEGPLLLASQPILTSGGEGPSPGTLIFARYFDNQYVQELSATLRLPLNLALYSSWQESGAISSYVSIPPSTYIHPVDEHSITGYYVVNDINGRSALVLGTTLSRATYQQGLVTLNYIDFSVTSTCVFFSLAMLLLSEKVVLSRLHKLSGDLSTIAKNGDFSANVSVSGNDEITYVGKSINGMLAEIKMKTVQLRKSERFSAIGELATMVAHDLRNPLQGIANGVFYLKRGASLTTKEKKMLDYIEQAVKYSDKIVNDLLDYSRDVRLELTETNPQLLLKESFSAIMVPENLHVQNETENNPTLTLDVPKIRRTFTNIISNAIDAMPDGGSLLIQARQFDHMVNFTFADSGVGMKKEVLEKMFTPLYTTKAKGMGFGLSICKRIIEAHGGKISAESTFGKGTTFTISLPLNVDSKGGENS